MSRFDQLQHKLLGIAFIVGPLACVTYFAALAPIGWRMLAGAASVRSAEAVAVD
jgi:hypothetical protein